MNKFLFHAFKWSVVLLLLVTSVGKLVASGSYASAHITDPIFSIPFRLMLWLAGGMELVVAFICVTAKQIWTPAIAIAILSTNFLLYRCALLWVGHQKPCGCMGSLTEALHISPSTADTAMKIILAYLLIGSYATLFWLWQQRKNEIFAQMPAQ